jgi:hypothetical protein
VLPDDINSVNPGDEVTVQLMDSSLDLMSAPEIQGKR